MCLVLDLWTKGLEVDVGSPKAGATHFQCVYARIATPNAPLMKCNALAQEALLGVTSPEVRRPLPGRRIKFTPDARRRRRKLGFVSTLLLTGFSFKCTPLGLFAILARFPV